MSVSEATRSGISLIRNQHPDLFVVFMGWYEDPHSIYLTMEYIEHGDLAQYIKANGAKAARQTKAITTQVLRALVVLHSRKICHRDLKPGVRNPDLRNAPSNRADSW